MARPVINYPDEMAKRGQPRFRDGIAALAGLRSHLQMAISVGKISEVDAYYTLAGLDKDIEALNHMAQHGYQAAEAGSSLLSRKG